MIYFGSNLWKSKVEAVLRRPRCDRDLETVQSGGGPLTPLIRGPGLNEHELVPFLAVTKRGTGTKKMRQVFEMREMIKVI